jgi:hypothetical protein
MQSKSNLKWGQIEYLFDIHTSEFTRGLGKVISKVVFYYLFDRAHKKL